MNNKINKLNNPKRTAELNPAGTLRKIGIKADSAVFDYGAGTGVFTIAAAMLTKGLVYAYDIDESSLEIIKQKANEQDIKNIVLLDSEKMKKTQSEILSDFALLSAVYHEIAEKESLFKDIKNILKENGKAAVIEFQDKETEMGPPVSRRVGIKSLEKDFSEHGFELTDNFILGDNFYVAVFSNKNAR